MLTRSESGSGGDPESRAAIGGHGFEGSAPIQVRGRVFARIAACLGHQAADRVGIAARHIGA